MTSDADTLQLILTVFPAEDRLVERAFRGNPSFRDLCEDYRKCVATLHRWKRVEADQAPRRVQEYTQLLLELGSEIQTMLVAVRNESPQQMEESH